MPMLACNEILTLESREIVDELRHLEEKLHMWREVSWSILIVDSKR